MAICSLSSRFMPFPYNTRIFVLLRILQPCEQMGRPSSTHRCRLTLPLFPAGIMWPHVPFHIQPPNSPSFHTPLLPVYGSRQCLRERFGIRSALILFLHRKKMGYLAYALIMLGVRNFWQHHRRIKNALFSMGMERSINFLYT